MVEQEQKDWSDLRSRVLKGEPLTPSEQAHYESYLVALDETENNENQALWQQLQADAEHLRKLEQENRLLRESYEELFARVTRSFQVPITSR